MVNLMPFLVEAGWIARSANGLDEQSRGSEDMCKGDCSKSVETSKKSKPKIKKRQGMPCYPARLRYFKNEKCNRNHRPHELVVQDI